MAKPDRISNLSLKRDGNVIKASWKNPSNKGSSIDTRFWFDRKGVTPVDVDIWHANRSGEKPLNYTAADRFWSKGAERVSYPSSFDKNYDRNRFHPVTAGKTLAKVQVGIAGWSGGFAPWTWANYAFGLPRKPTVSWAFNTSTSVATVTVETNEGKDQYERYDTMILVKIRKADGKEAVLMNWSATKSTKWQRSWDLSGYITNLQTGGWVSVRCWAYARGIAGDNPASGNPVYGERNIVFPVSSTPGTPTCDKKAAGGRIKVPVSRNGWWVTVQLQRKVGTGSWTDVQGATDSHEKGTLALYDSYGSVDPQPGVYTYYRVKTTRDQFTIYSAQVRADCIYTAKTAPVCNATRAICSASPDATGQNATVVMGFTDSTANEGCELSWSDFKNAWNSTTPPSTADFTGVDNPTHDSAKASGFKNSRTVSLTSLTPGTSYYLRVRRYRTVDNTKVYSAYSETFTFASRANAASSRLSIIDIYPDGNAIKAIIGYTESEAYDGTEVSWSTDADAWQSNQQPATMQATWEDATSQSQSWAHTQTVWLKGLDQGKTYYIRARRYKGDAFTAYTNPESEMIPSGSSSADVRCGLVDASANADGKSAKVIVGWDGDHSGCEVTWSDRPDAWESNEQPRKFDYTWTDDDNASSGAWSHTSTCMVTGLTEGTTYYVRARSYYNSDPKAYSDYTAATSVTPYSAPGAVVLSAPENIARGQAIELWWEVQSDQPQTEWHMHEQDSPLVAIADGTGSLCHASIDPERYGDAASVTLYVEAGCGGGLTQSNAVTVGIADKPACEAYRASTLTAQPASFEVISSDDGARLLATCYSRGCTLSAPDGDYDQLDGDAVWTQALTPSWQGMRWDETDRYAALSAEETAAQDEADDAQDAFEATDEYAAMAAAKATLDELTPEDEGYEEALEAYLAAYDAAYATDEGIALQDANAALEAATAAVEAHAVDDTVYAATVTMPVAELYDGGNYWCEFNAVENVAGLASDTASVDFAVAYAHQAPEPSASISVDPDTEGRKVVITLAAPSGAAQTDAYDVYRQTPSGYELIAYGKGLGDEVTDLYAPFGDADTAYRIACRTADGDISWTEYAYEMPVSVLRFDWDGESAEFPWNIKLRESMEKDYETRRHVDGSMNGYWDRGVKYSGSFSTDVIRIADTELLRLSRQLGSYAGAVLVRDASGKAMQCNVDVNEVAMDSRTKIAGLSFTITAMKTTDQYMAMGTEETESQNG